MVSSASTYFRPLPGLGVVICILERRAPRQIDLHALIGIHQPRGHAVGHAVDQYLDHVFFGVRLLGIFLILPLPAGVRNLANDLFRLRDGRGDIVEFLVVLHVERLGVDEPSTARSGLIDTARSPVTFTPLGCCWPLFFPAITVVYS